VEGLTPKLRKKKEERRKKKEERIGFILLYLFFVSYDP
jgi:hypothetical protein